METSYFNDFSRKDIDSSCKHFNLSYTLSGIEYGFWQSKSFTDVKKWSSKDHENIDAVSYCRKCEIYMCNKCLKFYSQLFQKHQLFTLEKDQEIFTGFCQEKEHNSQLKFFCKTHNNYVVLFVYVKLK